MESVREAEERKNRTVINPFAQAGFLSKLGFIWIFRLFYKGYKTGLTEDDIYPHLVSHDSEILGNKLEKEWNKEVNNKKNPSLWKALSRVFGKEIMFFGVGILGYELIRISMPIVLSKLLEYFEPDTTMTLHEAYMYAGIISFTSLTQMILIHHTFLHISHLGMRVRVAVIALVYRKAIKLSKPALAETTIGQMVNLISNDVARFENCVIIVNNIWIGPIQLFIILGLLYSRTGWAGIPGIGLLLCCVPFQSWIAKKALGYRRKTAIKTDERIHLMNEIINGIQVIKMYTWEKPFAKIVEAVRKLEMKAIKDNSVWRAMTMSMNLFLTRIFIYISIVIYVLSGNRINSQYVYAISLFYELLRQCVSQVFSQGVTQLAEASVCTERVKQFLLYDEYLPEMFLSAINLIGYTKTPEHNIKGLTTRSSTDNIGISLNNVSTKWIKSNNHNTLDGIHLNVSTKELAIIIGKVGSGKSTILHVLLGELPLLTGTIDINGTISYASQEPWLFVGSVRQNILFGQDHDIVKYHEVVRVCALERDFELFPYGDRTIIGERGVSLSGGQRARINLARAIYKEADIYLLDDPLSGVDAQVGKQLFEECIGGYLKDKCVVLVTHQLQYLKDCNKIYLLTKGKVDHAGTYKDLKKSGNEFTKLLEEFKRMEDEAQKEATEETRKRKKTLSATGGSEHAIATGDPTFEKEAKIDGKVTSAVYKTYFFAGGNSFKIGFLAIIFIFSQLLVSGLDYFLSLWVNIEEMKREQNLMVIKNDTIEDTWDTSKYTTIQIFWFALLTEDICIITYTVFVLVAAILLIVRALFFFRYCIQASINLHNNMFLKIVHATMRFFNKNPSGRILNRFSKDMNLIDEYLPITLSDSLQVGLMVAGAIIVVSTVTPLMLIPTSVIFVIFYLMRNIHVTTSRDIKRLEAIKRSPIYSHLTASLQGLTTIRAFRAQEILKKEFDNCQDVYSSTQFMYFSTTRAFGYWLDLHTVVFVTLVTFSFLILKTETNGGSVGLAITQAISLAGWCQYGMRQWSEMENTMTSVERVEEYANITPEDDSQANEPPKSWPENGNIQFDNVCLRYASDEPYVLQNVNFKIESTEKVGIVGRTGAGKSSLIAALFRLAENDGRIIVDNIDIKTLPLNRLRSSLSIIPQEPVLFSGTLRKNLDPFEEYSDEDIWSALEEVQLKNVVFDLPQGLETKISEGGSNFSVGQRQLVCLARAIVRNSKIIVLDEATASVDSHTDRLIQSTIRKKFKNCTVLTIAHRLHTIMDSNKVLVMDAGTAVEFDRPYILLQNEKGVFSSLVKQAGKTMAANLTDIATEAYHITLSPDNGILKKSS